MIFGQNLLSMIRKNYLNPEINFPEGFFYSVVLMYCEKKAKN